MNKTITVLYDNRKEIAQSIQKIVGPISYGEIIVKKQPLSTSMKNIFIDTIDSRINFINISNNTINIDLIPQSDIYILIYSNVIIQDYNTFQYILKKLEYLNSSMAVSPFMYIFNKYNDLCEFTKTDLSLKDDKIGALQSINNIDGLFLDISILNNFLFFISKGLDTRYFNHISGDDFIITKTSSNVEKIKKEYNYYHLLPDHMKIWFIMPFDLQVTSNHASYKMEKCNTTDLALRYIHNSLSPNELNTILDKLFYFIKHREQQKVSKEQYIDMKEDLYINKVEARLKLLKNEKDFSIIETYIKNGTKYEDIDHIYKIYYDLYHKHNHKDIFSSFVIGHGDLCFSNILYYSDSNIMKLIDSKGALSYGELFTNPYYDIAKLSHSICGCYDFFNANLFSIYINNNLQLELQIFFNNSQYKTIFKSFLEQYGYDYKLIRIYEASLFLSMLPLHMDYPQKVLGFIMNSINILEEIKNDE